MGPECGVPGEVLLYYDRQHAEDSETFAGIIEFVDVTEANMMLSEGQAFAKPKQMSRRRLRSGKSRRRHVDRGALGNAVNRSQKT